MKANENRQWVYCPVCKSKTRTMVRDDTTIRNFPLYCPKCKRETIVNVINKRIIVIKEPDMKMQSR